MKYFLISVICLTFLGVLSLGILFPIMTAGKGQQFTWRTDYLMDRAKAMCDGKVESFNVSYFGVLGKCK